GRSRIVAVADGCGERGPRLLVGEIAEVGHGRACEIGQRTATGRRPQLFGERRVRSIEPRLETCSGASGDAQHVAQGHHCPAPMLSGSISTPWMSADRASSAAYRAADMVHDRASSMSAILSLTISNGNV